jgi:hypothetical protein
MGKPILKIQTKNLKAIYYKDGSGDVEINSPGRRHVIGAGAPACYEDNIIFYQELGYINTHIKYMELLLLRLKKDALILARALASLKKEARKKKLTKK